MKYNPVLRQLSPTLYRSDDEDPWFLFEGPFERGTYELEFKARVLDDVPPSNMKLYYAHPDGAMSEQNTVLLGRLPRDDEPDRIRLLLNLMCDVPSLRLDPLQTMGRFHFSDVQIHRVDPDAENARRPTIKDRCRAIRDSLKKLVHPPGFAATTEIDIGEPVVKYDHVDYAALREDDTDAQRAEILEDRPHVVSFDLPFVVPLNLRVVSGLPATLNVLVPGMAMRSMSGGPNTVINLTYRLAQLGVPVRYLSTDVAADSDHTLLWNHIAQLTGIAERLPNVEIVDAHDRTVPTAIGPDDVFLGTAWWTVQMVKHALPLVSTRRFLYLIQDFEPGFIAWSTAYALALETYGMDFRGIICSRLLAEYLSKNCIGRFADAEFVKQCLVFEPAIDATRFYAEDRHSPRKRRLLFYARPNAPRNMYELGLAALHAAVQRGVFAAEEWELLFMGEKLPPVDLGRGVTIRSYPWFNYERYAQVLRRSDVGLSLMLSPHTSYPPLEMAACGATVVTNTFAVKTAERLSAISENILPVEANLETIVDGLAHAVQRVSSASIRKQHSQLRSPSSWDDVFNPLLPGVFDQWLDCLTSRKSNRAA